MHIMKETVQDHFYPSKKRLNSALLIVRGTMQLFLDSRTWYYVPWLQNIHTLNTTPVFTLITAVVTLGEMGLFFGSEG